MTNFVISAGQVSGYNVTAGSELSVLPGGESHDSVIFGEALEIVDSGALSVDDVISAGGLIESTAGGTFEGDSVLGGAAAIFGSGFTASAVTVANGGQITLPIVVSAGVFTYSGTVQSTQVSIDGVTLDAGASLLLNGATIVSGGTLSLVSGIEFAGVTTVSSGGTLAGPGAVIAPGVEGQGGNVIDLGTISGLQVGASDVAGTISVSAGGVFESSTISDGIVNLLSGGHASGITISGVGGGLFVNPGGAANLIDVELGTLLVSSAGSATSATISSGSQELFLAGADLSGTVIDGGADLTISDTQVSAGQVVVGGLLAATSTFSGLTASAGVQVNYVDPTIENGGELKLESSEIVVAPDIDAGGLISGPGTLANIIVNSGVISGGTLAGGTLHDYGEVVGLTVGNATFGGTLDVTGSARDVHMVDGTLNIANSGTVAVIDGALISGGLMFVGSGTQDLATDIFSGGLVFVSAGGIISGATIHTGAILSGLSANTPALYGLITDHGSVGGLEVRSGGDLVVEAGGAATAIEVIGGGSATILSKATASDLVTLAGGQLIDDGADMFSGDNALHGGLSGSGVLTQKIVGALVVSGGASQFSGQAVISGGTIELAGASNLGAGSIRFAAPSVHTATLELLAASQPSSGGGFAETLVNFGSGNDGVDLRNQAYITGAAATLSGTTLTLVDGGYTARFTLSGATAASYSVTSDGHGGTLIAAAGGGAGALFVQAIAAIGGGRGVGGGASSHSAASAGALTELLMPR